MYLARIILFLSISVSSMRDAVHPALEDVRLLYSRSAASEDSCRTLMAILNPYSVMNEPVLAGYRGAATMIMARYVFNPFTKLRMFRQGRSLLEEAISRLPGNAELRYVRYSIQTNCPSFLGYNDNLSVDKAFLLTYAREGKDDELKEMIVAYLSRSNRSGKLSPATTGILDRAQPDHSPSSR